MEKTYTTFQIAEMCGVRPTTIISWVKQKRIAAFVTPGGHRRVRETDLLAFLRQYQFPIPEGLGSASRRRILVVEDEASVGRLLKRALEEAFGDEVEVDWIDDGIQALLELGKKPVDLMISDVVMPVVDGAKVLATLKADPKTAKIKVIGMTGTKLAGEKLKFMEDHTDAFYYKPFNLNQIVEKSRELLAKSRRKASAPQSPLSKKVRGRVSQQT